MTMLELVKERLLKTKPDAKGSFNLFFKITEDIGLKLQCSESYRDIVYNNQKDAAKYDLGPDTYGKIEVEYLGQIRYGYLTEIVQTIDSYQEFDKLDKDQVKTRELKQQLKIMCGFYFGDLTRSNVGIKNNEFVCIDFDDFDNDPEFLCNIYNQKDLNEDN